MITTSQMPLHACDEDIEKYKGVYDDVDNGASPEIPQVSGLF